MFRMEYRDTVQGRMAYDRAIKGSIEIFHMTITEPKLVDGHISPDYIAILSDNPDNENSGFIIEKPCFTDPSRHYVQYLLFGRVEQ